MCLPALLYIAVGDWLTKSRERRCPPAGLFGAATEGRGFSQGKGFLSTPGSSRRQGLLFRGVSCRRATPDPGAQLKSARRSGATLRPATGVDRRSLGVQVVSRRLWICLASRGRGPESRSRAAGISTAKQRDEPRRESAVLEPKNLLHIDIFNELMGIKRGVNNQAISHWIGDAFAGYNASPNISGVAIHYPQSMILNDAYCVCPTCSNADFAGSPCLHACFIGLK